MVFVRFFTGVARRAYSLSLLVYCSCSWSRSWRALRMVGVWCAGAVHLHAGWMWSGGAGWEGVCGVDAAG